MGGGFHFEMKNNDVKIILSLMKRVDEDRFDPQFVGGAKPQWTHNVQNVGASSQPKPTGTDSRLPFPYRK